MPRVKPKSLPKEELYGLLDEFWTMVATLESKDQVKNFFRDLLSETESLMLARRLRIAKLLLRDMSYDDIARKLKTGNSTIASVHRWLQSGFGGYSQNLPRLERKLKQMAEKHQQGRQVAPAQPYSFGWLKNRYPLHFLLSNIFDVLTNSKEVNRK